MATTRLMLLLVALTAFLGCRATSQDTRPRYCFETVANDENWTVLVTPLEDRGDCLLLKSLWVEKHNPALKIEYLDVRFTDSEGKEVYRDTFWPEATSRFAQIPNTRVQLVPGVAVDGIATVKSSLAEAPLKIPLLKR